MSTATSSKSLITDAAAENTNALNNLDIDLSTDPLLQDDSVEFEVTIESIVAAPDDPLTLNQV